MLWDAYFLSRKTLSTVCFGPRLCGHLRLISSSIPFFIHVNMAHNHRVFHAICAKCPGQNARRKHAARGANRKTKRFATSEETAYPLGLAKMIANCFVVAVQSKGMQMPLQSMHEVDNLSLDYLRRLRATSGLQPGASRIPPLVHTLEIKTRLRATN